ncbi:DivIVA domain-containing protein [Catenulispora sp. GP43]|uniref:DivIVA domain-containing protein n=1 Tax=Catenulispora sp. GP43 TaxID=3156263 RepID=UPI0035117264
MLYFQFLVVAAVFGAIAWVAAGRGGGLDDPRQDRPEPALADDRQLGRGDIDSARFAVGWRGYRMDQVDRLLDRLALEIDHRDRLIADLTRPAGAHFGEAGVGYEPVPRAQDAVPGAEGSGGLGEAGGATTATAVVQPGFGPGVGVSPGQAETAAPADQDPVEGNPLSSWYRRPENDQ